MHREVVGRPVHHALKAAPRLVAGPRGAERFVAGFCDFKSRQKEPVEVLFRDRSGKEQHFAQLVRRALKVFEW